MLSALCGGHALLCGMVHTVSIVAQHSYGPHVMGMHAPMHTWLKQRAVMSQQYLNNLTTCSLRAGMS